MRGLFEERIPDPKKLEQFQREISIAITSRCSLRCPYCVSNMFNVNDQHDCFLDEMGLDEFLTRFEQLFSLEFPLRVNIPGSGEPTESKYFVPLLTKLLEWGCEVEITSNLSGSKTLEDILLTYSKAEINEKIRVIASYHIGTYLTRKNGRYLRDQYLFEHFPRMVDLGCDILQVVTPMTPECTRDRFIVSDFDSLWNLQSFIPVISDLYHTYKNKPYPKSYTIQETRDLYEIRKMVHRVCHYTPPKGVESLSASQIQHNTFFLNLLGLPCYKNTHSFTILPTGDVRVCQSTPQLILGNIKDQDLSFFKNIFNNQPNICSAEMCRCKRTGFINCLDPHGVSIQEYYEYYYTQLGKPEIARLFEVN